MAANPWGNRFVFGRKPGGKGGHARDARGVQDTHLRNLHNGAHSLLRRLSKTGGDPPHTKEVKEPCWALVTKLLRTILKEVHKVRRFAAEAVSIGSDSLSTNGMFLYVALEELRVLREFAACDWHDHPKINQNIVRHLFETCLPRAVFENMK